MSESGEHLDAVRILNDRDQMRAVMAQAGEHPEVVLEATYGWYWAADLLSELGAAVHFAHPLGGEGFACRRGEEDFGRVAAFGRLLGGGPVAGALVWPCAAP